MSQLDNRSLLKQIDQHNYISHVLDIPEQLVEGHALGDAARLPALYAQAKQVLIIASGEMLPVAFSLQSLVSSYGRVPLVVWQDFDLPKWVSNDTMVIALDYNGDNESVLTAFAEAYYRRARLVAISIAGDLAADSRRYRCPHIALNYGAPARSAFFYTLSCLAQICKKLDLLELKESTIVEASVLARSLLQNFHPEVPQYKNNAKQLAEKIITRNTVLVSAHNLYGIAKKWQTTLAATGKIRVSCSTIGEFNDTIINSLGSQTKGVEQMVLMFQSKYDYPRTKLHQTLVYQVAQARKVLYEPIFMHPSGSPFGEIVLAALLGEMVSYYTALLLNADPSFTEATQYIKDQLLTQPMEEK